MKEVTQEESAELNAWAFSIADDEGLSPVGLDDEKALPYVGWFWRRVDFTKPFRLYLPTAKGREIPPWKGFMEKNKWDYRSFVVSQASYEQIIEALRAAMTDCSRENLEIVYQAIQSA